MKNSACLLLASGALLAFSASADVPKSLQGPHEHAQEVSGKITLFRVQQQGLEIGPPNDRLDAEVLVTVDTQKEMVFGLRYHQGTDPASTEIVDTLREAYLHNLPVTIQFPKAPGRKHHKIIWVQLNK